MGIGLPLVLFIANIISLKRLEKNGEASWDRDGGLVLAHGGLSPGRVAVVVLIIAGAFLAARILA
jgi:hypothetical protein